MKFYRFLSLILVMLLSWSCENEKVANFTLKGSIKGLKKGKVYLQKEGDSTIIDLDSVAISGQPDFVLQTNLSEPLVLYLKLFKNDGEEHYIPFFADKGEMTINTTLKNFNFDAEINGSKQQKLLEDYLNVMNQYNNQSLDLVEARFLAQKNKDSTSLDSLNRVSEGLFKRKYSYTIQYALNHNDSEVAAYLALYEIPNANPFYIDSIYNGLTEKVKKSYYGLKLEELIRAKDSID